jgi:hypothetical protein
MTGELVHRLNRIAAAFRQIDEALADEFLSLAFVVARNQDERTNQLTREFGRRDLELEDRLRDIEQRIKVWAEATDMLISLLRERGVIGDDEHEASV